MNDHLTEDQAVDWLADEGVQVCKTTLRAERADGKITYLRIRRRVFYPIVGLRAYLNRVTCQATTSQSGTAHPIGTSPGPSRVDRAALQRAKQIAQRQNSSLPPTPSKPSATITRLR